VVDSLPQFMEDLRALPWDRIRRQVTANGRAVLGRRDRLIPSREQLSRWWLALAVVAARHGLCLEYQPDADDRAWLVLTRLGEGTPRLHPELESWAVAAIHSLSNPHPL
jgi:hypothetical protein